MTHKKISFYLFFTVFTAAMGGLLFGYHTAVISGALLFLAPAFHLSIEAEGVVVSTILIGAAFGSLAGGVFADSWGRKRAMMATALLFVIGVLITALAEMYSTLLLGRILTGAAVGLSSVIAPVYLAETSPHNLRGRFVALYQLCVTIGILAAFVMGYLFASPDGWRWMFGIGLIPAVVQGLALFFVPETPSWLFKQGKKSLADKSRKRLGLEENLEQPKKGTWKVLFSSRYRSLLLIGLLLSMSQQITGINTVIYYAPKIFQSAGFTSTSGALLATIGIGTINILASVLALFLLDRAGRRRLLLIGSFGMAISLAGLSFAFFNDTAFMDKISVISLMIYVFFFAIGLGAVTSVLLSEIYPLAVRGKAMTLGLFTNWFFNYWVSLTFLDIVEGVGPGWTFQIFAVLCVATFFFILRFIPETKNKSLEQIEKELTNPSQ